MGLFLEWISRLFGSWKLWIIIPEWDVGVRIRLGKNPFRLDPGFHFRIPFIDAITVVNTRLRLTTAPPVTIIGKNGGHINRVITASVAFKIIDPVKAMLAYTRPSNAIMMLVQATTVKGLSESAALDEIRLEVGVNGIEVIRVCYVEDVEVRTLRLLQNAWQLFEDDERNPVSNRW